VRATRTDAALPLKVSLRDEPRRRARCRRALMKDAARTSERRKERSADAAIKAGVMRSARLRPTRGHDDDAARYAIFSEAKACRHAERARADADAAAGMRVSAYARVTPAR